MNAPALTVSPLFAVVAGGLPSGHKAAKKIEKHSRDGFVRAGHSYKVGFGHSEHSVAAPKKAGKKRRKRFGIRRGNRRRRKHQVGVGRSNKVRRSEVNRGNLRPISVVNAPERVGNARVIIMLDERELYVYDAGGSPIFAARNSSSGKKRTDKRWGRTKTGWRKIERYIWSKSELEGIARFKRWTNKNAFGLGMLSLSNSSDELHGSFSPNSHSHGCIRVSNSDIVKIAEAVANDKGNQISELHAKMQMPETSEQERVNLQRKLNKLIDQEVKGKRVLVVQSKEDLTRFQ